MNRYVAALVRECWSEDAMERPPFRRVVHKLEAELEAELEAHFPGLERFRLDAETTSGRDSYVEILGQFAAAERGVLFGVLLPNAAWAPAAAGER